MNSESLLHGVCLESVDFRLNFKLLLLSEYILCTFFLPSLRFLCSVLETKTGEGRTG